jgi:hypothetical protein
MVASVVVQAKKRGTDAAGAKVGKKEGEQAEWNDGTVASICTMRSGQQNLILF